MLDTFDMPAPLPGRALLTRDRDTATATATAGDLLSQLQAQRDQVTADQDGIMVRAAGDSRDLTEAEQANLDELQARGTALDDRIRQLVEVRQSQHDAAATRATVAALTTTTNKVH